MWGVSGAAGDAEFDCRGAGFGQDIDGAAAGGEGGMAGPMGYQNGCASNFGDRALHYRTMIRLGESQALACFVADKLILRIKVTDAREAEFLTSHYIPPEHS